MRISRALTAIHGIDNRMVRGAPSPPEAVARLMVFMGARPLVIHNAPFDMGFIETVLRERFLEAPLNDLFDTCRIAPVVFPGLASYRLGELSRSLGVEQGRGHRALDDSLAAMGVFLSCLREIDPAREMEYGPFERSYSLRSLAALEGSAVPLRWPPGFDAIRAVSYTHLSTQSFRTSLWAMTASSDDETRKGAIPISTSLMEALGASLVWSVESTR